MKYLEQRLEMCEIGKSLWIRNYCAGNEGNISQRLPDGTILCTPTGVSNGDLVAEQLCVVNLDGEVLLGELKPSSELKMHLEIYRRRADVGAVVHAHPKHVLTLAIANKPLPYAIYPEAELFLGEIARMPYRALGSSLLAKTLGEQVTPETTAIIMANHGATTFASDLRQAYYNMEILESFCQVLIQCKQFGSYQLLSVVDMQDLMATKKKLGLLDSRQSFNSLEMANCAKSFFGF